MASRTNVNLRIAAIVMLMIALTCFGLSRRFAATPADVSALTLDELKDGLGLSLTDAVLLGKYAYTQGHGGPSAHHCALSFTTADGIKAVASLEVFPDGPLYETMTAVQAGRRSNQLSFCATATALDMTLSDYLNDFVRQTFGPLTPYRVAPLELIWAGENPEDYAAGMAGERGFYVKCAAVCAALAASLFLISFFTRRNNK